MGEETSSENVADLFADAPELGAPLLLAHFPRAYLDVNREPYELDPRMFDGPWRVPWTAKLRTAAIVSPEAASTSFMIPSSGS